MIHKLFNIILIFAVFFLSLYLIEGACFRLVEPYAKWRLNFAWGNPDLARANPIARKFPLDHFFLPPDVSSKRFPYMDELAKEFEYAKKITSFDRPTRDRYYNFAHRKIYPLRNFEITNLGMVKEVVLPGMRRPATLLDVELGLARRVGMPVPYSKGIFIHLLPHCPRRIYEAQFAQLETAFSFLLNHGIACLLLNPENTTELGAKIKSLKVQHPNFSEKIFIYAKGEAVNMIEGITADEKDLLTGVIIQDPSEKLSSRDLTSSWFMAILSDNDGDKKIHDSIIERARAKRVGTNIYHARLSGLVFEESKLEKLPLHSNAIAYILNCLEFFEPSLMQQSPVAESDTNISLDSNRSGKDEKNISQLANSNLIGFKISDAEPTFECEVVQEYRQLNADDPEILNVSNRELVLRLGSSFEEMGEDILLNIAERDPLFYTFYLSLKEINKSQK